MKQKSPATVSVLLWVFRLIRFKRQDYSRYAKMRRDVDFHQPLSIIGSMQYVYLLIYSEKVNLTAGEE